MKKTMWGVAAGLAMLTATGTAEAQSVLPLAVEVRGGAAFPTGDFGEGLETGYAAGGNVSFSFAPMLAVYGGYSLNGFGIDDEGTGQADGLEFRDRGFDAGIRASIPTLVLPVSPWVKGGLVYHQLELDGDGEGASTDSSLGFEVGGGFEFPLGPTVSVTPGVSYTKYSVDFEDDETGTEFDVSHVKADIGLRIRL